MLLNPLQDASRLSLAAPSWEVPDMTFTWQLCGREFNIPAPIFGYYPDRLLIDS
jgi:hypothetical protein